MVASSIITNIFQCGSVFPETMENSQEHQIFQFVIRLAAVVGVTGITGVWPYTEYFFIEIKTITI